MPVLSVMSVPGDSRTYADCKRRCHAPTEEHSSSHRTKATGCGGGNEQRLVLSNCTCGG